MSTILDSYSYLGPIVPFLSLTTSIFFYSLALHLQSQRWLWLVPMLFFDHLALSTSTFWPSGGIDSLWGLLICIWISHSLSILFLEDHMLILEGKGILRDQSWWCKLWLTWNNCRLLFTSRAEKGSRKKLLHYKSRWVFTAHRLGKLLMYLLYNDLLQPRLLPGPFAPLYDSDFDPVRQTFFRRLLFDRHNHPVTARETQLRAAIAIYWAAAAYVLVDGAHTALSLLFVIVLRANRPEEWPPIFGDFRNAYTLRGFWGRFGHRLVVLPYGNVGRLLACFLGLRTKSLTYKLVVACSIFTLSGIVHAIVEWKLGDSRCWHLDIGWFFLNFVACAVEGFARFQLSHRSNILRNEVTCKLIGFVWVYLFFFWSVPKWQYPKMYWAIREVVS